MFLLRIRETNNKEIFLRKRERMCYIMKMHVSDYFNKGIKGHFNYDFVDVIVNDDNLLFLDPILIKISNDQWSKEANLIIESFFDAFYDAYSKQNELQKVQLLSHAKEQNGTRLGYGNGDNGKGNTVDGLLEVFVSLENLMKDIPGIREVENLAVLIPNFAEDGFEPL